MNRGLNGYDIHAERECDSISQLKEAQKLPRQGGDEILSRRPRKPKEDPFKRELKPRTPKASASEGISFPV
jgi:hypothetical protein